MDDDDFEDDEVDEIEPDDEDSDEDSDEEGEGDASQQELRRYEKAKKDFEKIKKEHNGKGIHAGMPLTASEHAKLREYKRYDARAVNMFIAKEKIKQLFKSLRPMLFAVIAVLASLLLVVGFLFLLISLGGALLEALFPGIFGGSGGGANSPNGIKGVDFYGIRTIYRDQEKSETDLIKNYANTVVELKTNLDADGALQITINLTAAEKTLPAEDYDFSQFATDYADTNFFKLVNLIADTVYLADNEGGTATAFADKIAGIKYFGFNQAISEEISNKVRDYLLGTSGAITLDEGNETMPTSQTLGEKITAVLEPENQKRTEMVYVKDYIFSGDDDYAHNILSENYVAFILMPKKSVNFSALSFNIGDIENIANLKIYLNNNSTELTPYVYLEGETDKDTIFQVSYSQSVSASAFVNIEAGTTSADNPLADGLSLYEILNSTLTKDYYLTLPSDESAPKDIYTYVADGVGLRFENEANSKFFCAENETQWK